MLHKQNLLSEMKPKKSPVKTVQNKSVRRGRTFTGCWNCRTRKVKCDELTPQCTPCTKHKIPCNGYESRLVWVTEDQKSYTPNRRRFLPSETTWNKTTPLTPYELDHFISLCDSAEYIKGRTIQWSLESRVPYGTFPSIKLQDLPQSPSPTTLPRTLIYGAPLKDEEAFLFQHYVHHVSSLMMPYEEDQRNPWKLSYPAAALYYLSNNHKSLYKGLLAQSAYNLAYLDCGKDRMLNLAAGYYASAMKDLRVGILDQYKDYGTLIATVMALVNVEIFSGNSNTWRTHLRSAWLFSEQVQALKPWTVSTFAAAAAQTLCIIKTISDSSKQLEELELEYNHEHQEMIVTAMTSYPSFGITIGASRLIISCITDIHNLARDIKYERASTDDGAHILQKLDQCHRMTLLDIRCPSRPEDAQNPKTKHMRYYHECAFNAAGYIYLHRYIFNSPPHTIQEHVAQVFHSVKAFYSVGEGNFSVWPAFVAAVESYEESDLASARIWLDCAARAGMGNRLRIKAVVQEVWRQRAAIAAQTQKAAGTIIIDWRAVMAELKLDIVLV